MPELEQRGCQAVTVDWPVDDPSADWGTATKLVTEAFAGLSAGDDLVVVGHSLGGYLLPPVAAQTGASKMIFLCAIVPTEGESFMEWRAGVESDPTLDAYVMSEGSTLDDDGCLVLDPEACRQVFYNDCDEETIAAAVGRIRRQTTSLLMEPFPMGGWQGSPRASYILCTDDRGVPPAWSRKVAAERLGSPAVELPGSHSPFLSRPGALADVLVSLA